MFLPGLISLCFKLMLKHPTVLNDSYVFCFPIFANGFNCQSSPEGSKPVTFM